LKASLQDEFAQFRSRTGATMVYITHDQAEAMALADRIAVMAAGRIIQLAEPHLLYREPATADVAGFIGKGATIPVDVTGRVEEGRVRIDSAGVSAIVRAASGQRLGPATLCLRPEDLVWATMAEPALTVICRRAFYQGGSYLVELIADAWPDITLLLVAFPGTVPAPGEAVRVSINDGWVVPAGAR
jgi:iron(III) transport system ATP-binding protein